MSYATLQDDWEEEDEEPKEPAPLAPAKKKGTLKQKLAEKEAAERRRQELGLGVSGELPRVSACL